MTTLENSLFEYDPEDAKKQYKKAVVDHNIKKARRLIVEKKISVTGFIGWLGGKKRMSKELIGIMPNHEFYVEIFMGSAAVFFAKPKARFNIINDINNNLVDLYNVVSNFGEEFDNFLFLIANFLKSREQFESFKKTYGSKKYHELPRYERAAIFYYLNVHTFNNDMAVMEFTHKWEDFTKTLCAQLILSRDKLTNTIVENMSYVDLIKKYNQKKRNVLFFADPPYVVADSGIYYEYVFDEDDHRFMAFQMKEIDRKGNKFIITYDDHPLIRELYKDFNVMEWEYTYSAANLNAGKKKQMELVITNTTANKQGNLFNF